MIRLSMFPIWLSDLVFTTATLLLAALVFRHSLELRKRKSGELLYLFLFWFSSTLLIAVFLCSIVEVIEFNSHIFSLSENWKLLAATIEGFAHLAFIFVAAASLAYVYLSDHSEEEQERNKYARTLEQVNQLVLDMATQVEQDIENLPTFENPSLVCCWEEMNCVYKDCILYGKEAQRCWQTVGIFCQPTDNLSKSDIHEDCRSCRVFTKSCHSLLSTTGEVLSNMFHLIKHDRDEIRQKNRDYLEMLGFVSHEFKTPLVPLHGYISLMHKGALGELNDKQRKAVEVMMQTTDYLQEMIDNYLDLAQLESGQISFNLRPVSLQREVIKPVLDNFHHIIKEKKIEIKIENNTREEVIFFGDCGMITIVFNNLLSNALKYGRKNARMAISLDKLDEHFEIGVKNEGGNIPLDMREKIFDKFVRLSSSKDTKSTKGTGLGLYNAKKIIQLHGGQIWVENQPDVTTEFIFTLPGKQITGDKK